MIYIQREGSCQALRCARRAGGAEGPESADPGAGASEELIRSKPPTRSRLSPALLLIWLPTDDLGHSLPSCQHLGLSGSLIGGGGWGATFLCLTQVAPLSFWVSPYRGGLLIEVPPWCLALGRWDNLGRRQGGGGGDRGTDRA